MRHMIGQWRLCSIYGIIYDYAETVARHMLRLFATKRDYPVLGYLSAGLTTLKWIDGSLRPSQRRRWDGDRSKDAHRAP